MVAGLAVPHLAFATAVAPPLLLVGQAAGSVLVDRLRSGPTLADKPAEDPLRHLPEVLLNNWACFSQRFTRDIYRGEVDVNMNVRLAGPRAGMKSKVMKLEAALRAVVAEPRCTDIYLRVHDKPGNKQPRLLAYTVPSAALPPRMANVSGGGEAQVQMCGVVQPATAAARAPAGGGDLGLIPLQSLVAVGARPAQGVEGDS